MEVKRGLATLELIKYIFYALIVAILMGVAILIFFWVDFGLDQDVEVGQVNLRNVSNQTIGQISDGFIDNADTIGIMILFGMIIFMFGNAYFSSNKPILFIVADIFIIVFALILSIYVSQTYQTLATASVDLDIYINDLPNVSKFILNLPFIVPIVGGIIMILTYAKIRRDGEPESNVLGF